MTLPRFLVAVVVLTGLSAAFFSAKRGDNFLPGDCPYYAWTALSILHDGDLDLSNQLGIQKREDLVEHEGFFAVSPAGVVVPKHSTLLPLLSVPLLWLFGLHGLLLTNLLLAIALVAGVAHLAGNTPAARWTALALFVTSSWWGYCFNYSNDLLGAACIVWAYGMARRERGSLAGLFAGLAVWSKVYAAIILLPLAILILPAGWLTTLKAVLGSLVGLVPMLVLNAMLYGGPFVTGYDRDARVTAEGFRLTEHYSRFNQPLGPGLAHLLFDFNVGMIATSVLWFLWPLGLWLQRRERWAWAAALGSLANVLVFTTYDEWNASTGGNRFLFPAVALGGALLAPLIAWSLLRLTHAPRLG